MASNQNDNGENEIALALVVGLTCLILWYVVPQVLTFPLYWLRYGECYVMQYIPIFGIDKQASILMGYLNQVDPMAKGYRDWIIKMYESKMFYILDALLGLTLVAISVRYQARLDLVSVKGMSVDPEWAIAELSKVDYPHLRPFVNFNPLNRSETHGVWRLPETMMDFTRKHEIMPMCSGCKLPLFTWDDGTVDCESHHERRNLLQGAKERYCRVKKPKDTKYFFDRDKASKIFINQVERLGMMPDDSAMIPKMLEKSPHAYMAMALSLCRLEEKGFIKQDNTNVMIADMANMVKGYRKSDGVGVYNNKMVKIAYQRAAKYMCKEIIEKYDEPLNRHGYISTYLLALFDYVHLEKGVLPSSFFSHMIGFDRLTFYALNSAGSPSPFVEAWGVHYHFKAEVAIDRPIIGKEALALSKKYTDEYAIAMGDGEWNP